MRKLNLDTEELVVETFAPAVAGDVHKGTVHANATDAMGGCTFDVPCTREATCLYELCYEPPTNSPIYRQCYTPYVECSTEGYTCDFRCGVSDPITTAC